MNTRTKLVVAFILLIFVANVALFLVSLKGVEEQRELSYRMGFMAGCRAHFLITSEGMDSMEKHERAHGDCALMWAMQEVEEKYQAEWITSTSLKP